MRAIIKEEVNTQLPPILPQAVLDFATPVTEKNVIKSLEAAVLTWISQVAHAKEPRTSFDELMDTSFDLSAFVLNRLNIKDLTQEILVGPAFELLKGTCKSLTELEYHLKEYHRGRQVIPQDFFINNDLEYLKGGDLSRRYSTSATTTKATTYDIKWIEDLVCNLWSPVKDQKLYKFRERDFPRLFLQDIEDMLLLLIQQKLTNLTIDERYDLNVALCMFTSRIVIQRRVEDLQLGVKSYPKTLNLTKPDTFRSNLKNKTSYTAYSDPKRVIYKDQNNINRLMRAGELHKFSDGMLNDVRTVLHDIAKGIRMKYLPKRKWSGLDKRRAWVMVQDIDKQLYERRLMRNLKKFVGGKNTGMTLGCRNKQYDFVILCPILFQTVSYTVHSSPCLSALNLRVMLTASAAGAKTLSRDSSEST
ncbi:hypothetical protein Tco_0417507 [Tanacetum coccineum]